MVPYVPRTKYPDIIDSSQVVDAKERNKFSGLIANVDGEQDENVCYEKIASSFCHPNIYRSHPCLLEFSLGYRQHQTCEDACLTCGTSIFSTPWHQYARRKRLYKFYLRQDSGVVLTEVKGTINNNNNVTKVEDPTLVFWSRISEVLELYPLLVDEHEMLLGFKRLTKIDLRDVSLDALVHGIFLVDPPITNKRLVEPSRKSFSKAVVRCLRCPKLIVYENRRGWDVSTSYHCKLLWFYNTASYVGISSESGELPLLRVVRYAACIPVDVCNLIISPAIPPELQAG